MQNRRLGHRIQRPPFLGHLGRDAGHVDHRRTGTSGQQRHRLSDQTGTTKYVDIECVLPLVPGRKNAVINIADGVVDQAVQSLKMIPGEVNKACDLQVVTDVAGRGHTALPHCRAQGVRRTLVHISHHHIVARSVQSADDSRSQVAGAATDDIGTGHCTSFSHDHCRNPAPLPSPG